MLKHKIILNILILFLAFFVKIVQINTLPVVDEAGESYFSESIKKALITYATVRGVNAAVSLVKNSSVGVDFGINASISVGEVLDPIDDATERLSSLLTISIMSLGVLKLLYEISVMLTSTVIFYILIFSLPLLWVERDKWVNYRKIFINIVILLAIARMVLPAAGLVNRGLTDSFFQPRIDRNKKILKTVSGDVEMSDEPSLVGKATYYYGRVKFLMGFIWKEKKKLITSIINLTILYGGILIIQVFLLPLFFFWLGIKIVNLFWDSNSLRIITINDERQNREPI